MHFFSKKTFLLFFVTAAFIYGCTNNKADSVKPVTPVTCDTANLTFSGDINPIVQQNCTLSGCHTNATMAGGYSFETYSGFHMAIQNERLIGAINHQSGFIAMPQNSAKLSDCDIARITQWVAIGAPNN
ncbi:hypothetical protein F0919_09555 [Taibaiella lutea]|uniref:Cytochrome c domain-containing protein n=1 Tax=Taibaiella lutea TaxID=2608001 RepID=A0A5M6CIK5_9BACT|nr:hypothetical protein [Taibaiella lutea]KAA5534843.1 hypothetical protein F0919_09555 [Taibaiella lutea]